MSERTYTTIDKSAWGPGPWQDEPDKIQWTDEATGLPCLIRRNPRGGNLCGYVGVSTAHPLFEADYGDPDVVVHGGLTYADRCQEGDEAETICHIPEPGQTDNVWWFGFDCAHSGDLSPARAADERRRYAETGDPIWRPIIGPWGEDRYRDISYVRRETARLASQLAAVSASGLSR